MAASKYIKNIEGKIEFHQTSIVIEADHII